MPSRAADSSAPPFSPPPPVVRICPPRGWISLNLRELWDYRELLFFWSWRDVKVKYKQALLGFAWAILVPVIHMAILGTIFGRWARLPSDGLNPYLFYLAGVVPWSYFAGALSAASDSLVGRSNLLTKIYFPRLIMPLGACVSGLVDFSIAFAILVVMIFCLGSTPAWTIVLVPLLVLIAFGTALGAGLVLAALNVKYRDVRFVVPFLIQVWMFCSIILPFSRIPEEQYGSWRYLYGLNPMGSVVEGFRWCLLRHDMFVETTTKERIDGRLVPERMPKGQGLEVRVEENGKTEMVQTTTVRAPVQPPWILLGISSGTMLLFLVFGLFYFKRLEKMFADVV